MPSKPTVRTAVVDAAGHTLRADAAASYLRMIAAGMPPQPRPTPEGDAAVPKFQFFHKSHKPTKLRRGKWVDPTFVMGGKVRKRFYADADGVLEAVLYLPTKFDEGGPVADLVRVRLVRGRFRNKPMDPTGYDERQLIAQDGVARIRFFYKGLAERGRAYHWQVMLLGDGTATLTGTHYAEFWRK